MTMAYLPTEYEPAPSDPLSALIGQAVDARLAAWLRVVEGKLAGEGYLLSCDVKEAVRRTGAAERALRQFLRDHPTLAFHAGSRYLIHWPAFAETWNRQQHVAGVGRPPTRTRITTRKESDA